jgi:hypothetical protein
MRPSDWQDIVQPRELVLAARSESLGVFVALYADTGFAVVRLPSDGAELAAGLVATLAIGEGTTPVQPALSVMSFSTALHDPTRESLAGDRGDPEPDRFDEAAVQQLLTSAAHFIVPLRKRADVDTAFVDRISVGRARNKDIVLRHGSISKFHGWFQVDEANTVYFADAGSKNGTRVGGVLVAPRAPTELHAGTRISLGRIELAYCPTELLWRALRGL